MISATSQNDFSYFKMNRSIYFWNIRN
jgi:hypothetical protein